MRRGRVASVIRTRDPAWWCGVGLLAATMLAVAGHGALLHWMAAFLIAEDPLEPAAAIVVLAGGFPIRELEAAELYRAGAAPRIVLVPERQNDEPARQARGLPTTSQLRQELLARRGVPPAAILILEDEASTTLDELQIVARAIPFDDTPVVLVTSKYHARRVGLVWSHIAGGRSRGIVRTARRDPFSLDDWWRDPRSTRAVIREYVGLLDLWAGFPVARRVADSAGPQ
jgi:uncharacterized SAM-binding protein YcdF (DUF218 family)